MNRLIIGAITVWLFFFPFLTFANGGNIRIAGGKYLVNISSAPVTPVVGEKVAMLISFADIAKNELLKQNIRVWIEIRLKAMEEVVFPQQEFLAENGVLEFQFIYPAAGLHELFVRFEKPDEPGKRYETEDFLIDVQPAQSAGEQRGTLFPWLALSLFGGGLFIGFLFGRRHRFA